MKIEEWGKSYTQCTVFLCPSYSMWVGCIRSIYIMVLCVFVLFRIIDNDSLRGFNLLKYSLQFIYLVIVFIDANPFWHFAELYMKHFFLTVIFYAFEWYKKWDHFSLESTPAICDMWKCL